MLLQEHDVLLKWTKTLQESRSHHFVQIPLLGSHLLCPVSALRAFLHTRPLNPQAPLFAYKDPPYYPVIDTSIMDVLKFVLSYLEIPYRTSWHMVFGEVQPCVLTFKNPH